MQFQPPYPYPNVLEASRGLLIDVCKHLSSMQTNYLVVGGWVPYLRCKHPVLVHPGTRDVDILLNDGQNLLEGAVDRLEKAGYVHSAKHDFQMLRILKVNNKEFVFNVDLMHPSIANKEQDLFQDIMDLNILEAYDPNKHMMKRSILFPSSAIMFQETLFNDYPLTATHPLGGTSTRNIPLLDEVGSVLSKCDSIRNKKRQRDSFDIYYILTSEDRAQIATKLRSLYDRFPDVAKQLDLLKAFLGEEDGKLFDRNVLHYADGNIDSTDIPSSQILTILFS